MYAATSMGTIWSSRFRIVVGATRGTRPINWPAMISIDGRVPLPGADRRVSKEKTSGAGSGLSGSELASLKSISRPRGGLEAESTEPPP